MFNAFERPIVKSHKAFSSFGSASQQQWKMLEFDWNRRYMLDLSAIVLNNICISEVPALRAIGRHRQHYSIKRRFNPE
jgi:hypothetical protein